MKFTEFDLHPALIAGIEKLGFTECTDIQNAAIPHILAGRDVAGLAQTGTGKTAAFLLPLMDRILKSDEIVSDEKTLNSDPQPSGEQGNIESDSDMITAQGRGFSRYNKNNFILVLVPTRELADQVCSNVRELCPGGELKSAAVFGGTSYDRQIEQIKQGADFIVATP
ncbi:MAG: DEAD/DEAH box helicase, partial [Bdellovibrionales bacterium]|nr:DEAD/DEAH box helicase [Bdellovibrionales bacterium]